MLSRRWGWLGVLTLWGSFSVAVPVDSASLREVDLSFPPAHLRQSTLIEFLNRRRLKAFPSSVESTIEQLIYGGVSPIRAFAPFGRSLQRPNTDATHPRILVFPTTANKVATRYPVGGEDHTAFPGTDYEGRLFFGFAKRVGQAEIISWNRGSRPRKFDFFVAEGLLPGETPRVSEVIKRETCTRCHQNEGPLFGIAPWSEILSHDPSDTHVQQPAPPFKNDPIVYLKDGVPIHREATPAPIGNNSGLAGETAVVAGIRLLQASIAVSTLCGADLQCRRLVLSAAIFNASQSTFIRRNHYLVGPAAGATADDFQDIDFLRTPMAVLNAFTNPNPNGPLIVQVNLPPFLHGLAYLEGFQAIAEKRWPNHNFALISHLLPDPLMVVSGKVTAQEAEPTTNRPSAAFTRIPVSVAVPYFYDVAFEALGFNYQDSLKFQAIALKDRMAPLQLESGRIPQALRPLLENWPPTREEILSFYGMKDDSQNETPNPLAASTARVTPPTIAKGLFQKYCLRCHDGSGEGPEIPFANIDTLREWNTNHRSRIVTRLTSGNRRSIMPPVDETVQPTATERKQMEQFFQNQAVDQARGIVFTNYLGVRVQNTTNVGGSYIVPTRSTAIVQSGITEECGEVFDKVDYPSPTELRVGQSDDGQIYLAMENFANYLPGNIIQTTMHRVSNGKCAPFAITRAGRLLRLAYSKSLSVLGVVSMVPDGGEKVAGLVHLATSSQHAIAVAKDGNLYRMTFVGSDYKKYRLQRLTVTGTIDGRWLKIGFKRDSNRLVPIAETVDGVRYTLREMGDGQTLSVDTTAPALNANDFSPNLLDRDSVLVNPN